MPATGMRPTVVDDAWDVYWRSSSGSSAYSDNGISHPLISTFWAEFFAHVHLGETAPMVLDVASGNGALAAMAQSGAVEPIGPFMCLDSSLIALRTLRKRIPTVHAVAADAARMPFPAARFDVAVSLFGVEYAGRRGFDEMLRVVAAEGRVGLVLHHDQSIICRDSAKNRDAVQRVQRSKFMPLASELFRTGFEAVRGADRRAYDAAARRLAPATASLESVMRDHGQQVADGLVARLYNDVADIHHHLQRYEPEAVLSWTAALELEIAAYAGRMTSMCTAAISEQRFDDMCRQLIDSGWRVCRAMPLQVKDAAMPLAWGLVAERLPA